MAEARKAGSTGSQGNSAGHQALATSSRGMAETKSAVKHAAPRIIPSAARKIRLEEGRTLMRIVASSALSSIGLTLARRALRHPLATVLGLGIVAGAIIAPGKSRPD